MTNSISNMDDVIDSRDVIARLEELRDERADLVQQLESADSDGDRDDAKAELDNWDATDGDELKALADLAEEAEGCADWEHGETLVRDSYFQDYAQKLADDCCPYPSNSAEGKALQQWPYRCIDWEQAARELKMDYSSVDFDGVTYWVRS